MKLLSGATCCSYRCRILAAFLWLLATGFEAASAQSCDGSIDLDQTLASGANWALCWRNDASRGLILEDVFYTPPQGQPRKVFKAFSLAQIIVVLNDNSMRIAHASAGGIGGNRLREFSSGDCPGGSLRSDGSGRAVLCMVAGDSGYAYKYYGTKKRAYALTLLTASSLSTGSYLTRVRLYDDGTFEAAVGNSGRLPSTASTSPFGWTIDDQGSLAAGYLNTYYWRLDIDVGASASDDFVEEIAVLPVSNREEKSLSINRLTTETGRDINADTKRSWRIRDDITINSDGHNASYHLEPLNDAHRYRGIAGEAWAANDFYVTRSNACELLSSGNSPANGCATDLSGFTNGESVDGADVVMWYRNSFYRLPRSEDGRAATVHWTGFTIVPRDYAATHPLATVTSRCPPARANCPRES